MRRSSDHNSLSVGIAITTTAVLTMIGLRIAYMSIFLPCIITTMMSEYRLREFTNQVLSIESLP